MSAPAAEVARAAAAIKPDKPADAVVLLDEQHYSFDASSRLVRRWHRVYRIDSPQGVEQWASVGSVWQPWYQKRPEIRARVISPTGEEHVLDPALLSDVAVRSDVPLIYDDTRVYHGPLPAIAVGAAVESEIVITDVEPYFAGGIAHRIPLGQAVPVMSTRIVLEAASGAPLRHALRLLPNASTKQTQTATGTRWVIEQGPRAAIESLDLNLPGDVPAIPQLELSTGASWQHVARSYLQLTEPKIRIEDVKRIVDPVKPGETPLQIARRLVARLHKEVRYTGIEFGEARLIPNSVAQTLKQKFGDCKDKATLLVAMLRASGVTAHLALLSAGGTQDVAVDMPGMGMFIMRSSWCPVHRICGSMSLPSTAAWARCRRPLQVA